LTGFPHLGFALAGCLAVFYKRTAIELFSPNLDQLLIAFRQL